MTDLWPSWDRPELERLTTERWGSEPHMFRGLTYNALLLFYQHGPNWMIVGPKNEVQLAVARR